MKTQLDPYECRVLGCLIEKEKTTPDQYPLTLNGLINACNQKSNREPVMSLDEATVQSTLDRLIKNYQASEAVEFHSRVPKYRHQFCNTEFGDLKFSEQEIGLLCVLLLRGPQTPGELRTRTNRLCRFNDMQEVELAVNSLMTRDNGPFVLKLPREPGKRESRYRHLFNDDEQVTNREDRSHAAASSSTDFERINRLEDLIVNLQREFLEIKQKLENVIKKID